MIRRPACRSACAKVPTATMFSSAKPRETASPRGKPPRPIARRTRRRPTKRAGVRRRQRRRRRPRLSKSLRDLVTARPRPGNSRPGKSIGSVVAATRVGNASGKRRDHHRRAWPLRSVPTLGDLYVSLRGDDDVLSIGLNRAMDLLSRARPGKAKGKNLGAHPEDGKPVLLKDGRYGAYVEHGDVRATLPAGTDPEALDVTQAAAFWPKRPGGPLPSPNPSPRAPSRPTGRQAELARPPLHPESQHPSALRSPRPGRS